MWKNGLLAFYSLYIVAIYILSGVTSLMTCRIQRRETILTHFCEIRWLRRSDRWPLKASMEGSTSLSIVKNHPHPSSLLYWIYIFSHHTKKTLPNSQLTQQLRHTTLGIVQILERGISALRFLSSGVKLSVGRLLSSEKHNILFFIGCSYGVCVLLTPIV